MNIKKCLLLIKTCYATWRIPDTWLPWVGSFKNSPTFPARLASTSLLTSTRPMNPSQPLPSHLTSPGPDHL